MTITPTSSVSPSLGDDKFDVRTTAAAKQYLYSKQWCKESHVRHGTGPIICILVLRAVQQCTLLISWYRYYYSYYYYYYYYYYV